MDRAQDRKVTVEDDRGKWVLVGYNRVQSGTIKSVIRCDGACPPVRGAGGRSVHEPVHEPMHARAQGVGKERGTGRARVWREIRIGR